MSEHVYLMMPGFMDRDRVEEYLAEHPEVREEIEHNVSAYGVPFLSSTIGWLKRDELIRALDDLVNEKLHWKLVELLIYPRDGSGEEYAIQYDIMMWDEHKKFEKAIEYEQRLKGFDDEFDG
jgi:hypothetical protein